MNALAFLTLFLTVFTAPLRGATIIAYEYLGGPTLIDFRGTSAMPGARGVATIESREGVVAIEADFGRLKDPEVFGQEYLTYVLWAVSPAGQASNLGEIVVKNGKARLKTSTQLQTFALVVSAEPHFAVTRMSAASALENVLRKDTKGIEERAQSRLEPLPKGYYAALFGKIVKRDAGSSFYLRQARNALGIARLEHAEERAPAELKKAEEYLAQAESEKSKKTAASLARQAAQQSENARLIAIQGGENP